MECNNKSKAKGGKNKTNPSPSHVGYKKKERKAMNKSERRKNKSELRNQEESFLVKKTISKFITAICEKDYSLADTLLKEILTEKIKANVKKIAKEKKYCCDECKRNGKNNSCGCDQKK